MKSADVKIGSVYLCKIGDELAHVIVVQRRLAAGNSYPGDRKARDTFDVRRVNEDRVLPKPRTAAALRELPVSRARLDVDGTAKPLTSIVGHAPVGSCQGPGITVPDSYRDAQDNSIPLDARAK